LPAGCNAITNLYPHYSMTSNNDDLALLDRTSLMKLGKEEIVSFALRMSNIAVQLKDLASTITQLTERLQKTEGELAISINVSKLLTERTNALEKRIIDNERVTINNGQYLRNRQLEIKRLPDELANLPVGPLKSSIANLLSLTETRITPANIGKCHKLGRKGDVIVELNCREKRDEILLGRKNLKRKDDQLANMNLKNCLIVESMCREYGRLDFICRQLKKREVIGETWFFNGRLFIRGLHGGDRVQISHIADLHKNVGNDIIADILESAK
jgi:hypothetical protein